MGFAVAEIRPGDVLLFHGKSFISWAIRKFDGTEVNHAAITLRGGQLAEAGGRGLQQRAITAPGAGEFIRVHRLTASTDLAPVLARADAYLAARHLYAYQQIILLAFLGMTRRIPLPRLARRLVRSVLDHAATAVMDLLPAGANWMICSEYVYRSFIEATDAEPDPYLLAIAGVSFGPTARSEGSLLEWGLQNVRDVPVSPTVAFGVAGVPTDPVQRIAAMEADLAPIISDYAEQLLARGETDPSDLPPLPDPSFGPPAPLPPQPSDDELLSSMAAFGEALAVARGDQGPSTTPSFGGVGASISGAALKGALEGVKNISADANFVTPGDLLKTPSLEFVGRLG